MKKLLLIPFVLLICCSCSKPKQQIMPAETPTNSPIISSAPILTDSPIETEKIEPETEQKDPADNIQPDNPINLNEDQAKIYNELDIISEKNDAQVDTDE